MGSPRVGSNPAVVGCAPLAEWSKALRSGRSHHSMAQVRILQGAFNFLPLGASGGTRGYFCKASSTPVQVLPYQVGD